jgi:drug/metabolite transporter (DMT)-like permease
MKDASLPITLIIVGLVWLAWHFRFFPDVDWLIAIGFMVAGVAVLAFDGINRNSIVTGPMLIAVGGAWLLHDQYRVSWSVLIPTLLILVGVLMLVARSAGIPDRRGSKPEPPAS